MKFKAQIDIEAVKSVNVTVEITMTLAQWRIIYDAAKKDLQSNWNNPKAEFVDVLDDVIRKYDNSLIETFGQD